MIIKLAHRFCGVVHCFNGGVKLSSTFLPQFSLHYFQSYLLNNNPKTKNKTYLIHHFPLLASFCLHSRYLMAISNMLIIVLSQMQSSDGFRRRAAITITPQNKSRINNELLDAAASVEKYKLNPPHKFQRINEANHAILRQRKKEQEFHRTIEEIEERKCTFYRLGFKSFEKARQRKVFGEVLGLPATQMRGTMFVGELWANHENARFLKENKIHMTKLKLMDKLQEMKKDYDEAHRSESESEIDVGSCRSIGTIHIPPTPAVLGRSSNSNSMKSLEISENLQKIKSGLRLLKVTSSRHNFANEMKCLQNCRQKIDHVERQYFLKMIEIL